MQQECCWNEADVRKAMLISEWINLLYLATSLCLCFLESIGASGKLSFHQIPRV